MTVGMLFPHRERCGIAIYSREVAAALMQSGEHVVTLDSDAPVATVIRQANKCDVVHVQYETGFFVHKKGDYYSKIMKRLSVPKVVSLHELYKDDPFVYPRTAIKGSGITAVLKRVWWDQQHPVQRAALVHKRHAYYASKVLLFYNYQKEVLCAQGVDPSRVEVIHKPVPPLLNATVPVLSADTPVRLGVIGFINPMYDVDLLFSTLESLRCHWTFTWIGGAKGALSESVEREIRFQINARGWQKRFTITGWLPQEQFEAEVHHLGIVLALFKNRSTSDSITRAMGAQKPVVASRLPLTEEIAGVEGCYDGNNPKFNACPIMVTGQNPLAVVTLIETFITSKIWQKRLFSALNMYNKNMSLTHYSSRLCALYRRLVRS